EESCETVVAIGKAIAVAPPFGLPATSSALAGRSRSPDNSARAASVCAVGATANAASDVEVDVGAALFALSAKPARQFVGGGAGFDSTDVIGVEIGLSADGEAAVEAKAGVALLIPMLAAAPRTIGVGEGARELPDGGALPPEPPFLISVRISSSGASRD